MRSGRCGILDDRVLGIGASIGREGDDPLSQACVGGENAVIAVAMDAGRREIKNGALFVRDGVIEAVGTIDDMPSRQAD